MSERFRDQTTGCGRLAVIVIEHQRAMRMKHRETHAGPEDIDIADVAAAIKFYFLRELTLDRIDQARKSAGRALTDRMQELVEELAEHEKSIPLENHL